MERQEDDQTTEKTLEAWKPVAYPLKTSDKGRTILEAGNVEGTPLEASNEGETPLEAGGQESQLAP